MKLTTEQQAAAEQVATWCEQFAPSYLNEIRHHYRRK